MVIRRIGGVEERHSSCHEVTPSRYGSIPLGLPAQR
jgi:hypothetical protein